MLGLVERGYLRRIAEALEKDAACSEKHEAAGQQLDADIRIAINNQERIIRAQEELVRQHREHIERCDQWHKMAAERQRANGQVN